MSMRLRATIVAALLLVLVSFGFLVRCQSAEARDTARREMSNICFAAQMYLAGKDAGIASFSEMFPPRCGGSCFFEEEPIDPWGSPFQGAVESASVLSIRSCGPDRSCRDRSDDLEARCVSGKLLWLLAQ
jgi:hypothetical protein